MNHGFKVKLDTCQWTTIGKLFLNIYFRLNGIQQENHWRNPQRQLDFICLQEYVRLYLPMRGMINYNQIFWGYFIQKLNQGENHNHLSTKTK